MKSVFCDLNFLLDIFLKREPFYHSSAHLFGKIENREVKGYLCALSFPTLFYLLSKELGREKAMKTLEKIRLVFKVAEVDERIIDLSLASDFKDFEDAVQYYSAVQAKAEVIITRDKDDYRKGNLQVLTSEEFLAFISRQMGF
ncbi:MAG: PIN domain-containing protein [Nitrospirae bacterium]|nr:PIN domain-containing protein [Nitrospirota bacterium]